MTATTARRTGRALPDATRRELGIAFSGAAGTHGDRRTRRARSRSDQRREAVRFDRRASGS